MSVKGWEKARAIAGAGPTWPVFPSRRQHISEMQPGEKLLLIRKLGGLGDILMVSCLFPDLFEQYPDIEVTLATPLLYMPLFKGQSTKLKIINYEDVYGPIYKDGNIFHGPNGPYHKSWVRKEILEEFDLIEDISMPCRHWETLMKNHGVVDGVPGLKWRNRMDRWSRWVGFEMSYPARTIIQLTAEETRRARETIQDTSRPVVVWCPISAVEARSYPWYKKVKGLLEREGFKVWYLCQDALGEDSLYGLSFREMGAMIAAADLVISADSAAFHWGGILQRPTLGLFNLLLGDSHAAYYPTVATLQLCDTPCCGKYYPGWYDRRKGVTCSKWYAGETPNGLSKCFHPESIQLVVDKAKQMI